MYVCLYVCICMKFYIGYMHPYICCKCIHAYMHILRMFMFWITDKEICANNVLKSRAILVEDLLVHPPYSSRRKRSAKENGEDDKYDVRGEISAETIKLNKALLP